MGVRYDKSAHQIHRGRGGAISGRVATTGAAQRTRRQGISCASCGCNGLGVQKRPGCMQPGAAAMLTVDAWVCARGRKPMRKACGHRQRKHHRVLRKALGPMVGGGGSRVMPRRWVDSSVRNTSLRAGRSTRNVNRKKRSRVRYVCIHISKRLRTTTRPARDNARTRIKKKSGAHTPGNTGAHARLQYMGRMQSW